jgi:hypothetical protein
MVGAGSLKQLGRVQKQRLASNAARLASTARAYASLTTFFSLTDTTASASAILLQQRLVIVFKTGRVTREAN